MLHQNHNVFGLFLGSSNIATQDDGASLSVGTDSRKVKGPFRTGRYGFTAIPSGTFTGSMTVWYSNLPNPDPNTASHWFQDTDLGTITLTSGTTVGRLVGNAHASWIRFSVNTATGTMLLSLWVDCGE